MGCRICLGLKIHSSTHTTSIWLIADSDCVDSYKDETINMGSTPTLGLIVSPLPKIYLHSDPCDLICKYWVYRCNLLRWSHIRLLVAQFLSCVRLSATLRPIAHQASLSFTISQSLLRLMTTESVMPPSYLVLCFPFSCLQSFSASKSFPASRLLAPGCQSIGTLASAAVLNIQAWFPLGLTGLISLQSKRLSGVFFTSIDAVYCRI